MAKLSDLPLPGAGAGASSSVKKATTASKKRKAPASVASATPHPSPAKPAAKPRRKRQARGGGRGASKGKAKSGAVAAAAAVTATPQSSINAHIHYEASGAKEQKHNPWGRSARRLFREHPHKGAVLEHVLATKAIPGDIEGSRFGPRAGSCYEARVLRAYYDDLLEDKSDAEDEADAAGTHQCYGCGHVCAHLPWNCPVTNVVMD